MRRGLAWVAVAVLAAAGWVLSMPTPPALERATAVSARIEDRRGELLRAFTTPAGDWRMPVRLEDVAPLYLEMLVAYEDRRFYSHMGVDPWAIARAAWQAIEHGRAVSGASTITMQTVRLLDPASRSKIGQALKAVALERQLSKREILEIYLTVAPYGGNLEGVRAASLTYFGKEPDRLSVAEAALLVALPQAPNRRPDRAPEKAREARDRVLRLMAKRGIVGAETAAAAMREDVPRSRSAMPALAAHLATRLRAQEPLRNVVPTTLDAALQRRVERVIAAYADRVDPAANLAVLVVRNSDAAVLAHVGSLNHLDSARHGPIDFSRAVRSPGSALKPFVYGLAFDRLIIHPDTLVSDAPRRFGSYAPSNFEGGFGGVMTVRDALVQSVNTVAVAVLDELRPAHLVERFSDVGVPLRLSRADAEPNPTIAVGGCGITLEELVTLYVGLANRGKVRPLRYRPEEVGEAGVELMSEDAAWAVADILAAARPPGAPAAAQVGLPRRIAYKTGTSAGFRDAWSVGFDALHTVGVWVGRADGASMPGQFGRTAAAPLLFRVFDLLEAPLADPAGLPPAGSALVPRVDLPERLVRFEPHEREASFLFDEPLGGARFPANVETILLKVRGGRPPFSWFADGRRFASETSEAEQVWRPAGAGAAVIEAVDTEGRSASVTVWIGAASAQ